MVSRVANSPIDIPEGVEVKLAGQAVFVKGKLGELSRQIHSAVKVTEVEKRICFEPVDESLSANALAGTSRALVNNMVRGVSEGFECKLEMIGVGYRAKAQGKTLNLAVGFSHPVAIEMPEGVSVETPATTEIVIKGIDKQKVFQVGANVRAVRPPEPYKGKGIRYKDERVVRKEAKKK